MTFKIIISIIGIVIALLCFGYFWYITFKKLTQAIIRTKELQYQEKELFRNIECQENKLVDLKKTINEKIATTETAETIAKEKLEIEYLKQKDELEKDFEQRSSFLNSKIQEIEESIKIEDDKLQSLKDMQLAYLKEQQRKEEMIKKQDYFRMVLSETAIQDIKYLREVQIRITQKDMIDKIIWSGYYKPAYDILMSHLFDKQAKVVCGIYKITCLNNQKAYIGQSVDIKSRFSDHVKSAISSSATTNKLYKEMREQGPNNFSFEILEEIPKEKLNERELYWIDFYGTKDFGLNTMKGNS